MSKSNTSRTAIRRGDRAVQDEAWIQQMLATAPTGVLATVADGQPFVNANIFVYDAARDVIYLHTARHGHTRETIEGDERAAFTVMEMGRLLPADTALEFSVEYASVIAFGRGYVVEDDVEAKAALQILEDPEGNTVFAQRDFPTKWWYTGTPWFLPIYMAHYDWLDRRGK